MNKRGVAIMTRVLLMLVSPIYPAHMRQEYTSYINSLIAGPAEGSAQVQWPGLWLNINGSSEARGACCRLCDVAHSKCLDWRITISS